MKPNPLSDIFVDICESQTHFDSLLSKINPSQKSKVARLMGAFLRRPLTIGKHYGHAFANDAEEFWAQSFIKLKKNQEIHECFSNLWEKGENAPNEGSVIDFPPSLIQKFSQDWGEERAAKMAKFLSQDPLTTIRFHRRAYGADQQLLPEIQEWLKSEGIPKSRAGNFAPRARVFKGFAKVQQNDFFRNGCFEIQDEGSQVMSLYSLQPELFQNKLREHPQTEKAEGEVKSLTDDLGAINVIDACAGAGGKTLALSDALQGRGRVYAYDIFERKVRSLRERADRAQERNIQSVLLDPETDSIENFHRSADVVLVDAPCSGYGVLRRNPDIKWNRKPLELARRDHEVPLPELQKRLLEKYSVLVKPNGRLIFGVCTFLKEESSAIVEAFQIAHPEFSLQSQGYVGPYDTDGFYMASFTRKE